MQQKISSTLLEVRKAYRLLYNYQDRLLDLVSYIGGKYGFSYKGGYSKFSDVAPRNGGGHLDNWAWDWLNLYFYQFDFKPKAGEKLEPTIHFSVFVVNDTGYFDARDADDERKTSKLDTTTFNSVEESKSKLIFVAGKDLGVVWGVDCDNPEFISQPSGEKTADDGGIMVFKHYSLERFENEEDAISCLKDFERLCNKKGIEGFKIIESI